jgi:hypothetical protein
MEVRKIDTNNKADVKKFVEFTYDLYKDCPQWVPPLRSQCYEQLDRRKNPFFFHSEADFFLAEDNGKVLGKICVQENRHYNESHNNAQKGFFYLFDVVDDPAVAKALFDVALDWCRQHHLVQLIGPKGFVPFDGLGMLYQGFEHTPALDIPYNYTYYPQFMEALGFEKEVDFNSYYANAGSFVLPERIARIAEKVKLRRHLRVKSFKTRKDVEKVVPEIVAIYNSIFVDNWEFVPVTPEETTAVADRMLQVVQPEHIKIIVNDNDQMVGFLITFVDISEGLKKAKGNLFPFGWYHILREFKKTKWINVNGMGILEEYRGLGGNSILYDELYKTIQKGHYEHADCTQMADFVVNMLADVKSLGGKRYKIHRVFRKTVE